MQEDSGTGDSQVEELPLTKEMSWTHLQPVDCSNLGIEKAMSSRTKEMNQPLFKNERNIVIE